MSQPAKNSGPGAGSARAARRRTRGPARRPARPMKKARCVETSFMEGSCGRRPMMSRSTSRTPTVTTTVMIQMVGEATESPSNLSTNVLLGVFSVGRYPHRRTNTDSHDKDWLRRSLPSGGRWRRRTNGAGPTPDEPDETVMTTPLRRNTPSRMQVPSSQTGAYPQARAGTRARRAGWSPGPGQSRQNSLPSGRPSPRTVAEPLGSETRSRVAPSPTSRSASASRRCRRSSPVAPGAARTSRCSRFFTVFGSGTRWKNSRGPAPSGSTTADRELRSSSGTPQASSASSQLAYGGGGAAARTPAPPPRTRRAWRGPRSRT